MLSLAAPAAAWELGAGAGVNERARELERAWRPYNKTMADLDMVKRADQDEPPDWVLREQEKMVPRERPFGRIAGFTLRRDDARFLMVGRHRPLTPGLPERAARKERLQALRLAEAAAVEAFWKSLAETPDERWELVSTAPGRETYASAPSLRDKAARVVWSPLDWYRDPGKEGEFYVLLYADKPRRTAP